MIKHPEQIWIRYTDGTIESYAVDEPERSAIGKIWDDLLSRFVTLKGDDK